MREVRTSHRHFTRLVTMGLKEPMLIHYLKRKKSRASWKVKKTFAE
jgi:hypothetical protein